MDDNNMLIHKKKNQKNRGQVRGTRHYYSMKKTNMETFVFLFTTQLLCALTHLLLHSNHQKLIDTEQFL